MPEVQYQENGDNRLLRHVLVDLWNQQCYWCRCFKDYADLQIDHVLPKTAGKSKRDGLQRAFGMDASYDVNALYNLAPICGTCNREKSDADLTKYGVLAAATADTEVLVVVVLVQAPTARTMRTAAAAHRAG